jgi:hypothetical protein
MTFLIASVTAILVGFSETSPGVCEVNWLVEHDTITTERVSCDSVPVSEPHTI